MRFIESGSCTKNGGVRMVNKKVYIVTKGCYSDYRIVECFASKKAAKEYIESLRAHSDCEDDYFDEPNIEEWDLLENNPMSPQSERGILVYSTIRGDGSVDATDVEYPEARRRPQTTKGYISRFVKFRKGENMDDFLKRAQKILIDEYYNWKAGGMKHE